MALDLFVNFERSSNSSLFYRVTSASNPTFTVKLSDLSLPNEDLSVRYFAQSALNNGPFSDFNFNSSITFNTSTPCICSIQVRVSAEDAFTSSYALTGSYSLSGMFVGKMPEVNFVAYPSYYIDETSNQLVSLNSTNYRTSPGVYFYGEGHTEVINLSAAGIYSGVTANWFVGNSINNVSNNTSALPVTPLTQSTAIVSVSTTQSDERVYPICLWATDNNITTRGPVLTYQDSTGILRFYPFFLSTLTVNGGENRQILRGSIKVLPYPDASPSVLESPFALSLFTLPLDYSLRTFRGIISTPIVPSILTEQFVGTQWDLQAVSEVGEWSVMTTFLSSVLAYQFQLSYDQTASEIMLPGFKSSPKVRTTTSLSVSSYKDVYIDLAPYDWLPKRIYTEHSATAAIGPMPIAKLHIPNYFNQKEQDVLIEVVAVPEPPLEIKTLTIRTPHSSNVLVLSGEPLSIGAIGTMRFNKVGVVDLSATALLRSTVSGLEQESTTVFQDMLEVVNKYDDEPNEDLFQTSLTPLKLTYGYQPKITPNEWAVADNVNSIIEKLYTTIDDLDDYTKLYEKRDKFYGWIGPNIKQPKNTTITESSLPLFVWQDLECPGSTEVVTTWSEFECDVFPSISKTWEYHDCVESQTDPTCIQKYCLEWKWKSRKRGATNVDVTWKTTKSNGEHAKKWLFEKCEVDSNSLNCDRDSWKISTIDSLSFPIPYCTSVSRCAIIDCKVNSKTDQLVVVYPTEINLLNKDYFTTYVARRGGADEFFAFQNIVGITIDMDSNVLVLDSFLPRISVFKVVNNDFKPFTTWGSYGLANNPQGFNAPQDIHIDANNSVWIADTGNNCVKKFTIVGRHLMTLTHEKLNNDAPLSVCIDSKLNIHCLTETKVIVFDQYGNYSFEYVFPEDVVGVKKINASYNREMVYVTYTNGIVKYFRTGIIFHYTIKDLQCNKGISKSIIQGYSSVHQDEFRNVYVTVNDKILKIPDLQKIVESKASLPKDLYWSLDNLLIHKEEYIQPWVYLKSFHRLWDNIELLRNSLFYELEGCKAYTKPTYAKTDLIIGQNEIVSNAVINRLSEQLWTNLESLIKYFDPNCGKI